ncbi:MAG: rRNA m(5)U939 methyltransferase [Myxococcales bacterium]|nr:rRNA m(5)U939 methyltransferase [Myxococcales bacterium]
MSEPLSTPLSTIELTLDSLAFGGEAVGRDAEGRVAFVAGGAPGDRVVARVTESKKSFVRAELLRVVTPGAARVEAPCPIVDRCGGCPWQHVDLGAQLAAKQAIVVRALGRSGADIMPVAASPAALGYRTRVRMTARNGAVGFAGRRSHAIVDVERCIALDPILDEAMQAVRRSVGALVGEEGALSGLVQGGVVEIALASGRGADQERLQKSARALVGQRHIARVSVDDPSAPAAGFAQANAAQNEVLRRLVREAARAEGARVLELYAGDGNFTRDLAAATERGVAVEGDRPAVARLQAKLKALPGWQVAGEPAVRAVERLVRDGERFDVVVLDPPRAGAADVVDGIAKLAPARIVYVSCDPMTLARDVATLGARGYRARTAWPVDMMPQTWHIEVVCLLQRASDANG